MTTFDCFPLFRQSPWATPLPERSRGRGRQLRVVYRKCVRNTEVVYKDLYIKELYKDTS